MPAAVNLVGKEFGRLRVRERILNRYRVYWGCDCKCGGSHIARTDHLLSGDTTHCGCNRGG